MFIFENGASISNDEIEIKGKVLVADIFEMNNDLKAMIVFDAEKLKNIELMEKADECVNFKCAATAMNTIFDCNFRDITIAVDYCNGSIIRIFMHIEDYEHHDIVPESKKERKMRVEILKDSFKRQLLETNKGKSC